MQESNENKELIENADNIAEEQTEEKGRSTSKIFFFVLGLHVLVIVGAIALHMMRGPGSKPTPTSITQSNTTQNELTSLPDSRLNSPEEKEPLTVAATSPHKSQTPESSEQLKNAENSHPEATTPEPELHAQIPSVTQEQQQLVSSEQQNAAPTSAETIYIVRPGDSLSLIARRHNTTPGQILRDNAKKNEKILVGERLVIKSARTVFQTHTPAEAPEQKPAKLPVAKVQQQQASAIKTQQKSQNTSTTAQPASPSSLPDSSTQIANQSVAVPAADSVVFYTVKKGDTLYSISKKHGHTIEDIKKWNNMDSEALVVGKILRLSAPTESTNVAIAKVQSPGSGSSAKPHQVKQLEALAGFTTDASAAVHEGSSSANMTVHTVSAGETLSSVARKYNTTVENIKQDNELSTDFITIGQKLTIKPGTSNTSAQSVRDTTLIHVVKPGDTLSSISRTYSVPLEALFAANQLQSPNIRVGQKLNIPAAVSEEPSGKKTQSAPLPPSAEAAPPPTKWEKERTETYTVKPGDTLFKIALQHGVTVDSLSGANNISATDILRVGQQLVIPGSNTSEVAKN